MDLPRFLDKVKGDVEKAKKMCNKKKHKETLDALEFYGPLINKEIKAIGVDSKEYNKKLSIFKNSRTTLLGVLDELEHKINRDYRAGELTFHKLEELVKKKQKADMYQKLSGFVTSSYKSVDEKTKESIRKITPWRKGQAPYSQPGLDKDDKGKSGVEALLKINKLTKRIQDKQKSAKDWVVDAKKLLV